MWWLYTAVILYLINSTMGDEPKIVIVGAGTAGIAAASRLYENGFQNITILEAEDRIGGRVYTIWFDQRWMDLGAQWIHGQKANIVYELASPLGLVEVPEETDETYLIYDSQGDRVPLSISNNFMRLCLNMSDGPASANLKFHNGSVGDYFASIITAEAEKFSGVNQTLINEFINVCERFQNVLDGAENWYNTSAKRHLEYQDYHDSPIVNWKDRGFGTIHDILVKKYPNPENELPVRNNTKLNSEVVNIDYSSTEGKVLVELSNGEEYEADHVVVTPSLGVLKGQYQTLFTPELPEYKVKTIKGLSMGTVTKIYISFERTWWPNDVSGFVFSWNESDRQEYENDPDKQWLLDLVGLLTINTRPRILLGWILGPGALHMETLPEEQVANQTLTLLHKFVGKSYNITKPTGFLRSQWNSNKHFRGTFSFRSMESDRTNVWPDDLAAPLLVNGKPVIMFAGEATSPHHSSTVHGAIETGFREANRLIDLYKNTSRSRN